MPNDSTLIPQIRALYGAMLADALGQIDARLRAIEIAIEDPGIAEAVADPWAGKPIPAPVPLVICDRCKEDRPCPCDAGDRPDVTAQDFGKRLTADAIADGPHGRGDR